MALVSVSLPDLKKFVTDTRAASTTVSGDVSRLRASWDAFAAAENEFGPADTGLMASGAGGVLDEQLARWKKQEDFVSLVHDAFERADRFAPDDISGGPVLTFGEWRFDWHFQDLARSRGIDLQQVFTDAGAIVIPPPLRSSPIPYDSGFVDDPVCTATGYFVDTSLDLAMSARLQMLAWPRTYSSAHASTHAVRRGHGDGWGSWASVACLREADGSLSYTGPDGQRLRLRPDPARSGWRRTTWLRAAATATAPAPAATDEDGDGDEDAGVSLRWDQESPHPGETWTFRPDGTLASVHSPSDGTTHASYDDEGRMVRLQHEGGRFLEVHWDEGLITRVVASCGRTVSYRYDQRGGLVSVDSARSPRRYDLDDDGRIVAMWDGDGVRLCRNTYDRRGRVRRQESPFGRTTTFTYGDGLAGLDDLVTVVGDTHGGPESRWEHDRQGRVIALVDAEGHRLTRTFDRDGRCLGVTGFDGASVAYTYDDESGLLTSRRDDRGVERFQHDAAGRVVRHERPGGGWTGYVYDDGAGDGALPARVFGPAGWSQTVSRSGGVVHQITDADGVVLTIDSDDAGCPVAVTDGLGATTRFDVDASGEVAAVVLPDGARWVFARDDAGRLLSSTTPLGDRTVFEWTPAGRLRSVVDPAGACTRYEHGDHGEVVAATDTLGGTVALTWDRWEQLVAVSSGASDAAGAPAASAGRRWELDYSPLSQVTTVRDPAGHAWRLAHDAEGRLTGATDPLGHRRVWDYDWVGDLVREVAEDGGITHHVRDDAGRVVAVVDPAGGTTRITHDLLGRVERTESPDGEVVTRSYTPAGRLSAGGNRTFEYDAAGRLASADGVAYCRDSVGRVVAVTDPDGRVVSHTYDAVGQVVTTSVDGHDWHAAYDHAGRIVAITDPLGAETRFTYDVLGQVLTATDALGHTTRYEWNTDGHCTAVIDPLGNTTRYEWDARGLCTTAIDPLDRTTAVTYDAATRPIGIHLPTGQQVTHTLDPTSRLLQLAVSGHDHPTLTQSFTPTGLPTEVNSTPLTWSPAGHLLGLGDGWEWVYGDHGTVVAATDPDGRTTKWSYDAAERVVEQVSDVGRVRLERDGAGRVTLIEGPGLRRELRYDGAGQLVEQVDHGEDDGADGDSGRAVTSFVRDAVGRVVAVRGPEGATTTYEYDAAGQLVRAADESGSGGRTWTFQYDPAGRLSTECGPDGHIRLYGYDALHRLLAVTGPDAAVFGYDPLGRRTERTDAAGTTRYGWDDLGRLAWIEHPSGERRTFDVDPFGSLTRVDDTTLTWDPNGPIPELRAIGDLPVPGPVPLSDGDWRGSLRPTDAWGLPLPAPSATSSDGIGVGFLGELEVDGLVWLRNRAYDPATRQFLSPDPLPGDPGSPVLANPYHYAGNDPVGQVDPLGLKPMSMADYKQYKKVTTGVQWKNVIFAAEVALSVALMFTPLGPANAARMFAMAGPRIALSAGQKMAGMAINGSVQTAVWELGGQKLDEGLAWNDVRWGTVAKGTAFGAVGTMFGGAVGPLLGGRIVSPLITKSLPFVPGKAANVVSSWGTSSVLLGTTSAGYESYDLTSLPGSDGVFRPANVIASTVSAIPYTVAGGFVAPVRPAIPVPVTPGG